MTWLLFSCQVISICSSKLCCVHVQCQGLTWESLCDWRLPPSPARWILGTWTFWHLDLTILTVASPSFAVSPLSHAVHGLVCHQNPRNSGVPGSHDRDCLLWDQGGLTCTWESCNPPSGDPEGGKLLRNSCSTGSCLGKQVFVAIQLLRICIVHGVVLNPATQSYQSTCCDPAGWRTLSTSHLHCHMYLHGKYISTWGVWYILCIYMGKNLALICSRDREFCILMLILTNLQNI